MKTLYESILGSTKSGKDVFKPKYISGWSGQQIWQIDSDMKRWFENCDKNDFLYISKDCFTMVRKSRSKFESIRGRFIIRFNDGVFVLHMSINPQTRVLDFEFYFADDESRSFKEHRSYLNKQHDEIIKKDSSMNWNYVPKELSSIKGRERILDYIQKNIDAIIKQ